MNTKLSKTRKCSGCGLPLSSDPQNLAYTPNIKLDYCQRCFRLKHYAVNTHSELSRTTTKQILQELDIKKTDWVFCINDLLNIDFEVIKYFQNHPRIVYIFNKADLLVSNGNFVIINNNIQRLLSSLGIDSPHIILTSIINHLGLRKMSETIDELDWKEKIYFIGQTNSGKSSLINALIKYAKSYTKTLTTSAFVNTTIGLKKIKINHHNIIDTPGYNSDKSIINNLTKLSDIKQVMISQKINPIVFQIKGNQSFLIDNLLSITCESEKGSVVFYLSNSLKINRVKSENLARNLKNVKPRFSIDASVIQKEHLFNTDSQKKYNLCINGLGFISLKGISKIMVSTSATTEITLLTEVII